MTYLDLFLHQALLGQTVLGTYYGELPYGKLPFQNYTPFNGFFSAYRSSISSGLYIFNAYAIYTTDTLPDFGLYPNLTGCFM